MRLTRKVFNDLAIWMIGFGVFVGLVFPYFILFFGVDKSTALSICFRLSCVLAGSIVGSVNIVLSKIVVARRLKVLTNKMNEVEENLGTTAQSDNNEGWNLSEYTIAEDSDDEIGETAKSYNQLIERLSLVMKGELLISCLDVDNLIKKSLSLLLEITESVAGVFLIEKEGELVIKSSFGIQSLDNIVTNDVVLTAIMKNERVHFKLPEGIFIDSVLAKFKPKEIIVQPVTFGDIRLGVVLLASSRDYEKKRLVNLDILIRSIALSLHNASVHDQMKKLAALDPLTGVLNRRYGLVRLNEEYLKSLRAEISLGVIMLDFDHFSDVNNIHGHLAGDQVLAVTTKIIKANLRDSDVFMRYGGEEFCIVISDVSKQETYKIAEKIRFAVQENKVKYREVEINITISLGVASFPENDVKNIKELLSASDNALYKSKREGRNRTTIEN